MVWAFDSVGFAGITCSVPVCLVNGHLLELWKEKRLTKQYSKARKESKGAYLSQMFAWFPLVPILAC